MISAKRLAANRSNAQRSTGPRTAQGKLASRANSLKHGLTGEGEVLTPELAKAVEEQEREFVASAQPRNGLERALVHRIAVANARMIFSERAEVASRSQRKKKAAQRWERRMVRAVEAAIAVFEEDPSPAIEALESTSIGCRWLADLGRELERAICEGGSWTEAQRAQALTLLAGTVEPAVGDEQQTMLRLCFLALRAEQDFDAADRLLGPDTAEYDPPARAAAYAEMLPDLPGARAWLARACQAQITRLEDLAERLEAEREKPELVDRMLLAELDASTEGMRKARYETMSEMSFHRNLRELARLRKTGAEVPGMVLEEPASARAQNEPTAEALTVELETHYDLDTERHGTAPKAAPRPVSPRPRAAEPPTFDREPGPEPLQPPALLAQTA